MRANEAGVVAPDLCHLDPTATNRLFFSSIRIDPDLLLFYLLSIDPWMIQPLGRFLFGNLSTTAARELGIGVRYLALALELESWKDSNL